MSKRACSLKQRGIREQFPFSLLQYWIKDCSDNELYCVGCGQEATFSLEHYIDGFHIFRLMKGGMSEKEAVNIVWNQARDEQLQKRYTKYATTAHCRDCRDLMLKTIVGGNVATLASVLTSITGTSTVALVAHLNSMDDEGLPGATLLHHTMTIAQLGEMIHNRKCMSIHLK